MKHFQLKNTKNILNLIINKTKPYISYVNRYHKTFSLYSFIFIFLFFIGVFAVAAISLNTNKNPNFTTNNIRDFYKSRTNENDFLVRFEINKNIENQDYDKIVKFYTQFTKNKTITKIILSRAVEYNIPINLAFAQAWKESKFNPRARNEENENGSTDWGLYQLNDHVYSLTPEEFFNPDINAKNGLSHLNDMIELNDGNIINGLYCYNAGYKRVIVRNIIPDTTLLYVQDILEYEDMLNIEYNKWLQSQKFIQ